MKIIALWYDWVTWRHGGDTHLLLLWARQSASQHTYLPPGGRLHRELEREELRGYKGGYGATPVSFALAGIKYVTQMRAQFRHATQKSPWLWRLHIHAQFTRLDTLRTLLACARPRLRRPRLGPGTAPRRR